MAKYSLGELIWKVTGDSSQLNRAIDQSDSKLKKFSVTIAKAGLAITAALGAAAVYAGKKFVDMASDAEETQNKFDVVFAGVGEGANKMAADFAKAYGMSRTEAKTLLSSTGDLLTGFGYTSEAALELSIKVNKLAADLVSLNNFQGGTAEASKAITSALLGEREAVKALGKAVLDKDVEERVAILTAQGVTFETNRMAEAYATLEILTEQSKNAIGDFERSQKSLANQQRIATAVMKNQAEAIGNALLPYASLAVSAFIDMGEGVGDSLESFTAWTKEGSNVAKIANTIAVAVNTVQAIFGYAKMVVGDFVTGFKEVDDVMGKGRVEFSKTGDAMSVMNMLVFAGSAVFKTLGTTVAAVVRVVVDLARVIMETGALIGSFFDLLTGPSVANAKKFALQIGDVGASVLRTVKDSFGGVVEVFGTMATSLTDATLQYGDANDALLKNLESTNAKIKRSVTRSITEVGTVKDYAAAQEARRLKEAAEAEKRAQDAKSAADRKAADKALKEISKRHEQERKAEAKAAQAKLKSDQADADKAAEAARKNADRSLEIANQIRMDYASSTSELVQQQIDDAYKVAAAAEKAALQAADAAKRGDKAKAESAEEYSEAQVKENQRLEDAAKTSAGNKVEFDKDEKDTLLKQQEELKAAIDSLTPGGMIVYSMLGDKDEDETEEMFAERANATAEILGDMYGNMKGIIDDYYQNQIDAINADSEARQDAIDKELERKIASLDKAAMGEEAYNAAVEAYETEAANQKDAIEREAAIKSYNIELAQFRAKQRFDIADTISNTAVAVMKAYSQLGIFGKVAAAMIAVVGALQVHNISNQQPPEPPAFANGGIVPSSPGVPATGDNMLVRTNPGELILNESQQGNLAGKMSNNTTVNITVVTTDKRTLYKGIHDATKRGDILIDARAVV